MATAVHILWYYTIGLSVFVFSGAVQSAFIGLWSVGLEPVTMIITAILLNLRHTFYGPHIAGHYPEMPQPEVYSIAPFLTDELYALSVSDPGMEGPDIRNLGIFGYACWILSTAFGIVFTGGLPGFIYPILFLALPALFLALMVPRIRGAGTAASAAVSIVIAVVLKAYNLPEYSILISIGAGIIAGLLVLNGKKTGDVRTHCHNRNTERFEPGTEAYPLVSL